MSANGEYSILNADEIREPLMKGEIALVDVREPAEFAAERIHGAFLFPLSTFDPKTLPVYGASQIVFHCGSGMRSGKALELCRAAGVPVKGHMMGGLKAWKAQGLPTITIDPATGKVRDPK
ncbi:MAG: rhodanese-like domain-containing protein [Parvularculaceae bacterium]